MKGAVIINRKLKIIVSLLVISILLLSAISYSMWKKKEQTAVNDYKIYMSKQYAILNFLQDALDKKNEKRTFISSLELAKGEFIYLNPIINHVSMPKSLVKFHNEGKNLVDEILFKASKGEIVENDISKLENYVNRLRRMVRTLGASIVEAKSSKVIFKRLDDIGKTL